MKNRRSSNCFLLLKAGISRLLYLASLNTVVIVALFASFQVFTLTSSERIGRFSW